MNLKKILLYITEYIHITESLCCTPETNTTLYINYTSIKKKEEQVDLERDPWLFASVVC